MDLKIKRLDGAAVPPQYATDGAACLDFSAKIDCQYTLDPGESFVVGTGWAVEVPLGHVMLLFSRSGHGAKFGVRLANCVGVIDSDYRGEVMSVLRNDGPNVFVLRGGERFCQAMVLPVPRLSLVEVSELASSARGAGGFGSTGTGLLAKDVRDAFDRVMGKADLPTPRK